MILVGDDEERSAISASGTTEQVKSVLGELRYLAPESTMLRRFTALGASINTGIYEPHVVPIHDGRPVQDSFRLDIQGFEVVRRPSAVADFADKAEVDAVYVPEVVEFIKERTGADAVVSRGAVLRRAADPGEHGSQPQAALIHIDYSPEGAEKVAARVYAEQFPDARPYRRALATSVWRVFSPPPQDWPLALCRRAALQPAVLRRPGSGGPVCRRRRVDDDHKRIGVPLQRGSRVVVLPRHDTRRGPLLRLPRLRLWPGLAGHPLGVP